MKLQTLRPVLWVTNLEITIHYYSDVLQFTDRQGVWKKNPPCRSKEEDGITVYKD